jgi:hypothetical protein
MSILALIAWMLILKIVQITSKNIIWIRIENYDTIQSTKSCVLYAHDDDPTIGVETCSVSNKWKQKCYHISIYFVVPPKIIVVLDCP